MYDLVINPQDRFSHDMAHLFSVPCDSLTAPFSGSYERFSNGSVTYATFTCAFGYDLVGSKDLLCRADGTWDHNAPKCGTV